VHGGEDGGACGKGSGQEEGRGKSIKTAHERSSPSETEAFAAPIGGIWAASKKNILGIVENGPIA
jgi:hypothetical protein